MEELLILLAIALVAVLSPTMLSEMLKFVFKIPVGVFTVVDRLFVRFVLGWIWELFRLVVPTVMSVARLALAAVIRALSSFFSVFGFVFGKAGSVGQSASSSGWGQLFAIGLLLLFLCKYHDVF